MGTNIGDKIQNIENAVKALSLVPGIEVLEKSNYYETIPFGVPDKQENYINCCLRISTVNSAKVLLGVCLGIEAAMGRVRKHKFCSRIIDIDVLAYDDEIIDSKELVVPHPRIKERAFVMVPLNEVCENQKFGVLDFSVAFKNIDKSGVKLINRIWVFYVLNLWYNINKIKEVKT